MRILRIVYDWPPPWDGLAPHPYELTVSQVKLGHTFDVFCGRWPKQGEVIQPVGTTQHYFFRELIPGTMIITNALAMFLYYLNWRRNNKPDLIHAHGHFGFWLYWYRQFLKKYFPNDSELKIPLVVHFHNTVEGRERAIKGKGIEIKPESKYLSWPLAKKSDQLAVEVAAACIFVSEANKQEAVNFYGADPGKCYVVETGVNTELFKPVGGEEFEKTRRELGLDMMDKVIVNHGVMVERKNIHLLVEALKLLPDNYKLLLVGSGDMDYLDRLNELIKKYNLKSRVSQAGYTPYPEVPVAFQASNLFVLPSSFEGLPKVVMQSLACGVPALVSGFKLGEDIKGLYYLEKLDPQYIADKIKNLIENPQPVDSKRISDVYSWDQRAIQVNSIYEKVLGGGTLK